MQTVKRLKSEKTTPSRRPTWALLPGCRAKRFKSSDSPTISARARCASSNRIPSATACSVTVRPTPGSSRSSWSKSPAVTGLSMSRSICRKSKAVTRDAFLASDSAPHWCHSSCAIIRSGKVRAIRAITVSADTLNQIRETCRNQTDPEVVDRAINECYLYISLDQMIDDADMRLV